MKHPTCCLFCAHFTGHLERCKTATINYACDDPRGNEVCDSCEPCELYEMRQEAKDERK